jgi:hypothetical protein
MQYIIYMSVYVLLLTPIVNPCNEHAMFCVCIVRTRKRCGKAVCDACSCSSFRSTLPIAGFENEVRMCGDCFKEIGAQDRVPLCTVFDTKHAIVALWLDDARAQLATVGGDRVVQIWDVSALLSA